MERMEVRGWAGRLVSALFFTALGGIVTAVLTMPGANALDSSASVGKVLENPGFVICGDGKGNWNVVTPSGTIYAWDGRKERWNRARAQLPRGCPQGTYAIATDGQGNWNIVAPDGRIYTYDSKQDRWELHSEQLPGDLPTGAYGFAADGSGHWNIMSPNGVLYYWNGQRGRWDQHPEQLRR
ncbi:MAG: hypothetical protein HYY17_07735 [Planctomycetes bacterium]|nr:hypothetical protein [Planctomycetota bacterium]